MNNKIVYIQEYREKKELELQQARRERAIEAIHKEAEAIYASWGLEAENEDFNDA